MGNNDNQNNDDTSFDELDILMDDLQEKEASSIPLANEESSTLNEQPVEGDTTENTFEEPGIDDVDASYQENSNSISAEDTLHDDIVVDNENSVDEIDEELEYEEDEEAERQNIKKRKLIALAAVVVIIILVVALFPGSENKKEPVVNDDSSIDETSVSASPDEQIDELLNINPNELPKLEAVKNNTVKIVQSPSASRRVDETQIANVLGLLDESGQLIEVADKREHKKLITEIESIKKLLEAQSGNSQKQDKTIASLDEDLMALKTEVSSLKKQVKSQQNEFAGNTRPNIRILYIVEAFGSPNGASQIMILDLKTHEEKFYSDGDTLYGYKISVNGDRVILNNGKAQHSYGTEI